MTDSQHPLAFRKAERLCRQKAIDSLFGSGSRSLSAYPVRAVYRVVPHEQVPVAVLISVAKRRLHHATDRNRAKRQLREAFRKNRHVLPPEKLVDKSLHIALIWLAEQPCSTQTIEARVVNLLQRISERL